MKILVKGKHLKFLQKNIIVVQKTETVNLGSQIDAYQRSLPNEALDRIRDKSNGLLRSNGIRFMC